MRWYDYEEIIVHSYDIIRHYRFIGAGYVLYTGGEASPGYGLTPVLFCLTCSQGYIVLKKKDKDKKSKGIKQHTGLTEP